jgi:hypothetical protein
MRVNQLLNMLVLAGGLHAIGCATTDDTTDPKTSSQTSELGAGVPTGVRCSDEAWVVNFWAEPAQITLVGQMSCSCWGPELLAGVESNYDSLAHERTCSTQ